MSSDKNKEERVWTICEYKKCAKLRRYNDNHTDFKTKTTKCTGIHRKNHVQSIEL